MPSFAFRTSFTTTTKKVSLPTPISQLCKARLSREEVIFQGGSRAGEGREKCTTYYPFLCDMLAVEYESNALIVKVDTNDEYEFTRDMQVRGLPTLYFISPDPNKDAIRIEGLIPTQMTRDIIDNQM